MTRWAWAILGAGCRREPIVVQGPEITVTSIAEITAKDIAISSNWQGGRDWGHFHKGRTNLVGDLDGDGWQDAFIGNPGQDSFVLWNRTAQDGKLSFATGPTLSDTLLAWGGALADFDNDGDNDLFVTGGGNESPDFSAMYRNQLVETGVAEFVDVTAEVRVPGPMDPVTGDFVPASQAHANAADYNRDGLLDLFVSVDITPMTALQNGAGDGDDVGHNILWLAQKDGTYVDVAADVGINSTDGTQNSVSLDWDNDGDIDIYENTIWTEQHLWRNDLVETGTLGFTDVTTEMSIAGGDLRYPQQGFASFAADFNEDGWEDVMVFVRAFEPAESPYLDGHVMLINAQGKGFVDVAPLTGINEPYINWEVDTFRNHTGGGVMGSCAGDVNGDGLLDVYIGQGGPSNGTVDIFHLSTGTTTVDVDGLGTVTLPTYRDASDLIDFKAWKDTQYTGDYPPYPYRTHAVVFTDYDRDGTQEISVQNGGPADSPNVVREPARMFAFTNLVPPRWLSLRLVGNGKTTNRSAIGAHVTLQTLRSEDDVARTYHRWKHGGNGFATNNGEELYFALDGADVITSLRVDWPDGSVTEVEPLPSPDVTLIVDQTTGSATIAP